MSFWSSARLRDQLADVIDPHDPDRIAQSAYQLSVGPEAYISGSKGKTALELGEIIRIEPGQIAVLITEERITVPDDTIGFISLRSRAKYGGLINVSGFHVDPGFRGRLIFTVYNAGTEARAFARGDAIFLIWFAEREGTDDPYDETHEHQGQMSIPSDIITRLTAEGASPAKLDERIRHLELSTRVMRVILIGIFLGLLALFIRGAAANTSPETAEPPAEAVNLDSTSDPECNNK